MELGGAPLLGTTWPPYGDKLAWVTLSHYMGITRGPLGDNGLTTWLPEVEHIGAT